VFVLQDLDWKACLEKTRKAVME